MELQTAFDKIVTHVRRQGRRSMRNDMCAYRGDDGARCAFGVLIPDELYSDRMENKSAATVLGAYPRLAAFLGLDSKDANEKTRFGSLVNSLQLAHDCQLESSMADFLSRVHEIGQEYSLNTDVITATLDAD